jgi:hypothetical protein
VVVLMEGKGWWSFEGENHRLHHLSIQALRVFEAREPIPGAGSLVRRETKSTFEQNSLREGIARAVLTK